MSQLEKLYLLIVTGSTEEQECGPGPWTELTPTCNTHRRAFSQCTKTVYLVNSPGKMGNEYTNNALLVHLMRSRK